MEFVWRPFYSHLGYSTQIFSVVSYNRYSSPPGFNFDTRATYREEPFVDDPFMDTFNADRKCLLLYAHIQELKRVYRTNHLFVLLGDDFAY